MEEDLVVARSSSSYDNGDERRDLRRGGRTFSRFLAQLEGEGAGASSSCCLWRVVGHRYAAGLHHSGFSREFPKTYMMFPIVPKRLSWTPKSLPKPVQSKFKRMKQRLQMKVRAPDEHTDPQLEDHIEDDQAVATEAPPPQQDEAPAVQPNDEAPQLVCWSPGKLLHRFNQLQVL